jgi:shikimate dehydrogenase
MPDAEPIGLTLADLRMRKDFHFLVLGNPVDHSLSPALQNAGIKHLRLPYHYGRLNVPIRDLRSTFEWLRESQFLGWNITVPHKLESLHLVDVLDPTAKRLGAINTVRNRAGTLEGFNTDGPGLVAAVEEAFGKQINDYRIALLGAGGGAGQAVARYLAGLEVPNLYLINRTVSKLVPLANELRSYSSTAVKIGSLAAIPEACREVDLIINASSSNLGNEGTPAGLDLIGPQHQVFDMVYGPGETGLVRYSRGKGARAADGLLMLFYQGLFAFEIWFDQAAPGAVMREALFAAAGRKGG